ncbi:unnamed protein product [Parnassius apollo]|uniref:glutathione transferase n=1 Tax=Parnassius apollo TaxID=110799 RepID=A0A8S3W5M7_PARAO|nr:unnamed protein product [Parnassius apollo]
MGLQYVPIKSAQESAVKINYNGHSRPTRMPEMHYHSETEAVPFQSSKQDETEHQQLVEAPIAVPNAVSERCRKEHLGSDNKRKGSKTEHCLERVEATQSTAVPYTPVDILTCADGGDVSEPSRTSDNQTAVSLYAAAVALCTEDRVLLKQKMPKIKFYYFNLKALGESCRLLLAYAGEEFEDIRVSMEEWEEMKPNAAVVHYEKDPTVKAKKHEEFSKNLYPTVLKKLNEIIEQNNGHLALGKLTWADFVFAGVYDYLKKMLQMSDLDEKYPSFKKLKETVVTLPKVKEFCANVPTSTYDF